MGWGTGSQIAGELWDSIRDEIGDKKTRRKIAKEIIRVFKDYDCDTLQDCEQLMKDADL